jgi:hypothetical protein
MRERAAEVAAVVAAAVVITVAMAAPVIRAPTERVFGMEIVGRHHDPFIVMAQFERPVSLGLYAQPVTDLAGVLLARVSGPVAAYNWLVLLSFPLSAAAAYLLARHLTLSPAGAAVAALAYAFSPFHIAHAAYHPHIAQTQWLPLYLLALWRCLDRPTARACLFLVAAAVAVTLSNFYGGLIAAVITPVAAAAYWLVVCRARPRSIPRLAITAGSLVFVAAAGVAYASYAAGPLVADRARFAFPRADLFRYSTTWWSYLLPPVAHPLLGETAQRIWTVADGRLALLEHQVSLGWGLVALGAIAIGAWMASRRTVRQPASLVKVPLLVVVAAAALVCSLSPERTIGSVTFVRPSAMLYGVAPMFRSYARFGVLVQLMTALLAGIGVEWLRLAATRRAQMACVLLVTLAAGEYMVWPPALWRDVLPTTAHRWALRQPGRLQVLDCATVTGESAFVQAVTRSRILPLTGDVDDCMEPDLPHKLAATGYTHLVVRRDTQERRWFANRPAPDGLLRQARLRDGDVFGVAVEPPAVYTAAMRAFFVREHDRAWTWRWMATTAKWRVVNTTRRPVAATLHLELLAFDTSRRLEVWVHGRVLATLVVEPTRGVYTIGPLTIAPGEHDVVFHPVDSPTVADEVLHNGDLRRLSFALGAWTWTPGAERP